MLSLLLYLPIIVITAIMMGKSIVYDRKAISFIFLVASYLIVYGISGAYSDEFFLTHDSDYPSLTRTDIVVQIFASVVALCALFSSVLGYKIARCIPKIKNKRSLSSRGIFLAAQISLPLCVIFIAIYVAQYGGFSNALLSAAAIRSGYGETDDGATLTFVKYLMPLGIFPSMYYIYMYATERAKRHLLMAVISLSVLFIAYVLMSGRTRIVAALLGIFILLYYVQNIRLQLSFVVFKVLPLLIAALLVVIYGKDFFNGLSRLDTVAPTQAAVSEGWGDKDVLDSTIGYYTHRTYSTEIALIKAFEKDGLNFFTDTLVFPLYFIPERLTGIRKPDSISYKNTENLIGIYDSMIPPGLVAYGIYGLWLPGVVIFAFMYGAVFGMCDRWIYLNDGSVYIVAIPFLFVWSSYGFAADTRILVNSCSYILIFIFLCKLCSYGRQRPNAIRIHNAREVDT